VRVVILAAKSFVRLIGRWLAEAPLHFELRKAVESSFRGLPPTVKATTYSVRIFGNCYNAAAANREAKGRKGVRIGTPFREA
jgi:hypothetical protein